MSVIPQISFAAALATGLFLGEPRATASECGCKFQSAHSQSRTGTCAVREDMARDCNLIWGPSPTAQDQQPGPPRANAEEVFKELRGLADQNQSAGAESAAAGLSKANEESFWRSLDSELRRRSGLESAKVAADSFDHALAFLANAGATSDFRGYSVAALLFVVDVGLRQGRVDPAVRQVVLGTLLRHRDRLTAFVSGGGSNQVEFNETSQVKLVDGTVRKVGVSANVIPGCFDVATDPEVGVAFLVKTAWSPAKSRRCP